MAPRFKKLMPLPNRNCVACLLWPPLFFDISTVLSFRCIHDADAIKRNFSLSNIRLIFSLLILCEQCSKIMQIYDELRFAESTKSRLITIGDSLFTASHILVYVYNLSSAWRRVEVFQSFQNLLDLSHKLGMKNILTTAQAKAVNRRGFRYVLLAVVLCTTYFALLLKNNAKSDWMHWMHDVGSVLASSSLVLNFFQSLNEIQLYKAFYAKFVRELRKCTSKKIMSDSVLYTPIVSFQKITFYNFEYDLKRSHRFHDHLFRLIMKINDSYGLEMLLWYLFIIVLAISNTYMFTLKWFRSDGLSLDDFTILSRIITCICISVNYTYRIQAVTDMGDDIETYLFQYPVGKISLLEAEQVELLITSLHVQKPIIKATDIFTVGTKLLAPICGTIVTYVLVAHQFYSSDLNEMN